MTLENISWSISIEMRLLDLAGIEPMTWSLVWRALDWATKAGFLVVAVFLRILMCFSL